MEIVLTVAIVAVAAAALYVTATFNKRARQTTAPLIEDAVSRISERIQAAEDDLRRQLGVITDDLHQDLAQQRLNDRKTQDLLDQADRRSSNKADQFLAELGAIKHRSEQIGARQDQLSEDLQQLAARLGGKPESPRAPDDVTVGRPAAEAGRLYVEGLQFSVIRNPSEPGVRIGVERRVVPLRLEQLSHLGDASTIMSRAQSDQGFRDRLGEATSDYLATKVGDPVFAPVTEGWVTQNTFPETAAAAVCDRIGNGLNTIVTRQLDAIGTELWLPAPAAATGAGIGADLIMQPVTQPVGQAVRFFEVVGVVVGVATGLHPLALASAKMLAQNEFHQALARGISHTARAAFTEPEAPAAGRAPQTPEPGRAPQTPEPGRAPQAPEASTEPQAPEASTEPQAPEASTEPQTPIVFPRWDPLTRRPHPGAPGGPGIPGPGLR
jgi:hypothetical protein